MIPLVMILLFLREPEKEAAAAVTAGNAVIAGFSNSTYNLIGLLICLLISPIEKKTGKTYAVGNEFYFYLWYGTDRICAEGSGDHNRSRALRSCVQFGHGIVAAV